MLKKLLNVRYIVFLAVAILLLNTVFLIIGGAAISIKGYIEFVKNGFTPSEDYEAGLHLMEGLDAFMIAIIFIIFGLGIARIFLFNQVADDQVPHWLRFHDIKGLKVLVWETILVTLVIFCLQILLKSESQTLELLILPGAILILSVSLFFVRWKEK
jgi:uncharacterized membrane protein YqhA